LLAVLDAEREQLALRARLAQSSTGSATALVGVYRALAGSACATLSAKLLCHSKNMFFQVH
jgi:outer membrane protein TolC